MHNLLKTMCFIQYNAAAHRTHHTGQDDEQPDTSNILLVARIVH